MLIYQGLISIIFAILLGAGFWHYLHPLRRFPGPLWASITVFWYVRSILYGIGHNYQRLLHTRYGPIVRIGPSILSISDPEAVNIIYGVHNGRVFKKAPWYDGFDPRLGGRRNAFSERDEIAHAKRRRIVAPLYTQNAILSYEPYMEIVIKNLLGRMQQHCVSGHALDMSTCLHRYAFDILGTVFYGQDEGFSDEEFTIWRETTDAMGDFGAACSYLSTPFRELFMSTQLLSRKGRQGIFGFFKVIEMAKSATSGRLQASEGKKRSRDDDCLSKLLSLVTTGMSDEHFTLKDVTTEIWNVIWAGVDTTAILMNAIFYYLCRNEQCYRRLQTEITNAVKSGRLELPVKFGDANKLAYLRAVVLESMRMHPSLGVGLPRTVPPEGTILCGQEVPGGTTVVMNPSAVHLSPDCFGHDADTFRPERWLESPDRAAYMERRLLTFGHGPRQCIGRHITLIEIYKLVPAVLYQFDIKLLEPKREWKIWRGWFQKQTEFMVTMSERELE